MQRVLIQTGGSNGVGRLKSPISRESHTLSSELASRFNVSKKKSFVFQYLT